MAEIHREVTAKGQPKLVVTDPEYTFSLIGLITAITGQPVVGIVFSAIALKQSKRAGRSNIYALVGFILGIVFTSLWILFMAFYVVGFVASIILSSTHYWN